MRQHIRSLVFSFLLGLGLAGGVAAWAAWSPPNGAPPTNNVNPPLNTGTTAQLKEGHLDINNFLGNALLSANDLTVLSHGERVSIGLDTNNPAIELRDEDADGLQPYIDFSNDAVVDFDVRFILTGDDTIEIQGGNLVLPAGASVDVGGELVCLADGTNCPVGAGLWTDGGGFAFLTDTADNVGIGLSAAPNGKLHVQDSGVVQTRVETTTSGATGRAIQNIVIPSGGAGDASIRFFEGDGGGSADNILYAMGYNGSSNNFFLGIRDNMVAGAFKNILTIANGNDDVSFVDRVGIGTTSPQQELDIAGDIQLRGNRDLQFSTANGLTTVARATGVVVGTNGGNLRFSTKPDGGALAEVMRISELGRVGLGTASPAEKLEVSAVGVGSGTSRLRVTDTDAGENPEFQLKFGTGASDHWAGYTAKGASNEFRLWQGSDNLFLTTAGKLTARGDVCSNNGTTCLSTVAGGAGLWTDGGGFAFLTDTADNVGIGLSAAPAAKLHVQGTVHLGDLQIINNSLGKYTSLFQSNTIHLYATSVGGAAYPFLENGNLVIQPRSETGVAARDIVFVTGDTPTIRSVITRTGNVGIGTATPGAKLEVVKDADSQWRFGEHPSYPAYSALWSGSEDYTLLKDASNVFLNARGAGNIYFREDNNNLVTIQNNGNVGIGTTGPQTRLEVRGPDAGAGITNVAKFGTGDFGSVAGGRAALILGNSGGSGTDYARLQVRAPGSGDTALDLGVRNGSAISDRLTIKKNGNVGIGTTSPGYKLDVAGGGATTARFGTAAGDEVVIGNGAGKLTVGTVDPIYQINGKKYATYVSDVAGGVKTETTGAISIQNGSAAIDFDDLPQGSDLWLFWQTSNKNLAEVSVLLTPAFDGSAWYEKIHKKNTLLFKASRDGEVSFRLTAPRFDSAKWPNAASDDSPQGFNLDEFYSP